VIEAAHGSTLGKRLPDVLIFDAEKSGGMALLLGRINNTSAGEVELQVTEIAGKLTELRRVELSRVTITTGGHLRLRDGGHRVKWEERTGLGRCISNVEKMGKRRGEW
jgi:hypothetical protein